MPEQRVVLDTDFISSITCYKRGNPLDLFCKLFRAINKAPVVHPFVGMYELAHNSTARELIAAKELTIISYEDFVDLNDIDSRKEYRDRFEDIFRVIFSENIDKREDIFARIAGRSWGEVHSAIMATELNIPILYSNDGGAKSISRYYPRGRLTVFNAIEFAEQVSPHVSRDERRFISNAYNHK